MKEIKKLFKVHHTIVQDGDKVVDELSAVSYTTSQGCRIKMESILEESTEDWRSVYGEFLKEDDRGMPIYYFDLENGDYEEMKVVEVDENGKPLEDGNAVWVVTAVDTSETSDGKARVLAVENTEEEAREYVRKDMEKYIGDAEGMNLVADYAGMSAMTKDYSYGCEWNVEKVEMKKK